MNITDPAMIADFLSKHSDVDTIVHLAAIASIPWCENDKSSAWNTNVMGTRYLLEGVKKYKNIKKFIYLQTACIFSGEDDFFYDEDSIPNPKHYYGLTKLIAEEIVKSFNDDNLQTIIVRTNFTTMPWEYPKAFVDRYGTYLFAQWVAKWIKEIFALETQLPIIHLCWDRELSMYDYAKAWWSNVGMITITEYNGTLLTKRMSLSTKYWKTYCLEDSDFND